MTFMASIVNLFSYISDIFYSLYLDVYYAGFPLNVLDTWFYWLSQWFSDLAWSFYDFSLWVNDVQAKVSDVLSWSTIWSYLLSYVPNLIEIRDWFYNWTSNVSGVISSWWSSTMTEVLTWIDQAKAWTQLWIDYLQDQVTALGVRIDGVLALIPDISEIQAWFSNWTGNVSSVIDSWWSGALSEVQSLINSSFVIRADFWEGWQDWRDQVTEFFTDPEDWLYKSADRIIERFW